MARERTENNATSTLNGSIDNSQVTLIVASATSFSSLPQFRIIIDSEIMLVTGVASNTFTVTRGAEGSVAAAHNDTVTVAQILTKEGLQRYHRDWNNPFFDAGTPQQLLDSSGNTLTAASFTNINFTNGTKTDSSQGSIVITHATQGAANDYAIIKKAAPSVPWVWTVGFIPNLLQEVSDFPSCGPIVRDNATGELYTYQLSVSSVGTRLIAAKLASPTSSSTTFLDFDNWSGGDGVCWYQVEDDNTDLIFRFSTDGVNFLTLGQEPRLTFLTPDELGFSINNFGNANVEAMATIVAWDES